MILRLLVTIFLGLCCLALSVGYLMGMTLNPNAAPLLALACGLGFWGWIRDHDR